MGRRTTDHDCGDLAAQALARPHPARVSARDLKFGDIVVRLDTASLPPGDVRAREPDADSGPQRLAAAVVIVPILTPLMTAAWVWLR